MTTETHRLQSGWKLEVAATGLPFLSWFGLPQKGRPADTEGRLPPNVEILAASMSHDGFTSDAELPSARESCRRPLISRMAARDKAEQCAAFFLPLSTTLPIILPGGSQHSPARR